MYKKALVLCFTVAPMFAAAKDVRFQVTDTINSRPLAEAVVILPLPAEPVATNARMVQENRQFVPHVMAIPAGTAVAFPNHDNTQHHVYSFSPAKTFEIELYAGSPEAPVRFDSTGVVELGCNIHDHMQGFILVTDHYHGITNDDGALTLSWPDGRTVPDRVRVWHPRLRDNTAPLEVAVDLDQNAPATLSLEVHPEPETESSLERLQQRFREL